MAETLIATAAGEFGTSFLAKEATKIGIKQFIQTYGSVAFRTVSPVIAGGMLFEKVVEAYPPVDLQKEKLFGTPISSLPGMPTTYYDDTKYFKKPEPLKYIPTVHGGDKLPPVEQEYFPVEDKITTQDESFKIPEKIETNKGLEIPPQEKKFPPGFEIPKTVDTSILTKDKPKDITKQTEELVPEKPEDVPADKFFDIDKSIRERQSYLIYMKPEEYIKLTQKFDVTSENTQERTKVVEDRIENNKLLSQYIHLYVEKIGDNFHVTGEEGRHRALAFKNLGYTKIPVIIRGSGRDSEGTEHKRYTTPPSKSVMADEYLAQFAGFIPKKIISDERASSYFFKITKPTDFLYPESKRTIVKSDITKQTKDLVTKEPEFGALTEVEKQTAIALKGDKPDFYSRAIKSIEDAKPDKLTKTKWKSYIQSTKEELDYLGLTDFLKGNESITKQELLDFVKGKDIAATMIVKSVPKDQMNPLWEGYSLGGGDTRVFKEREHIVFQIGKDKGEVGQLYKEPHFDTEHGTGTFAHSRVQVGYDPNITSEHKKEAKYTGEDIKFKKFDNTLIIDEIQSQWIQTGQDKGFVSDWTIIKGSDVTKEFIEENFGNIYELKISKYATVKQTLEKTGLRSNKVLYMKPSAAKSLNPQVVTRIDDDIYYTFNTKNLQGQGFDTEELAKSYVKREAIPDLPLKDSKKFVELVLNEMIRKAVKDDRDSIAITNGQIQYNRYEAMGEKERQGLKKFYDTFVYDQLNKIAKNYGVKLERIDISEGEAPKELQDIHLDNQIKRAQDNEYKLKKVTLQFLFDRVQDTDIPGHAALYSNEGRGQGHDYIEEWLNTLVDNRTGGIPATLTTEEGLSDRGLKRWEKIRQNEIYIWIQERDVSRDLIGWDLPIVVKSHAINHAPELQSTITSAERQYLKDEQRSTDDNDLELYKKYLKDFKVPPGQEIGPEQLIKMKLPKKLQNDILKKSIRLTEVKPPIEDQTQRLFT